jgi:hypothetical protein
VAAVCWAEHRGDLPPALDPAQPLTPSAAVS